MAGWARRRHGDAARPGCRDQQCSPSQVGRTAPPHRSTHRASIQEWPGGGFRGGCHRLRGGGRRQDSAPAWPRPGHRILRGARASLVVEFMTPDQFFWVLSRVAGLGSYAALAVALVTGIALRTAVLDWLGSNRALRSLHEYTTVLWIPLAVLHVIALLLDHTARVSPIDVFVPFLAPYGTLAIGLGTLSLDILILVTVTAWMKRRMKQPTWQWLHRLAYVAFALAFVHAFLG